MKATFNTLVTMVRTRGQEFENQENPFKRAKRFDCKEDTTKTDDKGYQGKYDIPSNPGFLLWNVALESVKRDLIRWIRI